MATLKPIKFFSTTWMVVRHKSKPQIRKTRLPHWKRLDTLETCKPIFVKAPTLEPHCDLPAIKVVNEELTTYERLLGQEMLNFLDKSQMVGIYHENSITERDSFPLKKLLFYAKMEMKSYERQIVKGTLKGTKYESIIPLFESYSRFIFGENIDVDLLLTVQKKWPAFILLAGIVDNRLMSKDELVTYSKLKNLDTVRAQLCATLDSAAVSLSQNLNYHQVQLGMSLDALQKTSSEPTETAQEKL